MYLEDYCSFSCLKLNDISTNTLGTKSPIINTELVPGLPGLVRLKLVHPLLPALLGVRRHQVQLGHVAVHVLKVQLSPPEPEG